MSMQLHELLESVTLLIMTELKSNVFEERENNRSCQEGQVCSLFHCDNDYRGVWIAEVPPDSLL